VQYAVAVIDALFGASIFILSEFYEQTGMPKKMANRLLWQLRKQEIITVFTEDGGRGDLCLPAPAHHH
jgi:DNA-binding IclR family transcriptional regulator